jgi:hypothetical protein
MDLQSIPAYSEADWHRDRQAEAIGMHLQCPSCGRREWFHPIGVPPSDGSRRKYRACKVCGFRQEADGSPAYRCVMMVHTCLGALAPGQRCEYCGASGPRSWHPGCWRVVPARELQATTCQYCQLVFTPDHVIPWPVQAR